MREEVVYRCNDNVETASKTRLHLCIDLQSERRADRCAYPEFDNGRAFPKLVRRNYG